MAEGRSGLLHANTGTGKTLAAWLGALQALTVEAPPARARAKPRRRRRCRCCGSRRCARSPPTPRARCASRWPSSRRRGRSACAAATRRPAERSAQDRRLPTVLVTTPESLTLQLARADALDTLAHVQLVVVDEWHELLGNKRGVQVQLALARLRQRRPGLICWALSATLGNLDEALDTLVGVRARRDAPRPRSCAARSPRPSSSTRCCPSAPSASRGAATWACACCRRSSRRSRRAARRWSSPTRARRPSAGTRRCSRRGPTGPA